MDTRAPGRLGEQIAEAFLALKGCEVLDRNFWHGRREIDLVVRDGNAIVAVEVKMRRGSRFGHAAESIDGRKLERVRRALSGFVRRSGLTGSPRVDVVAIDISDNRDRMVVEHYVGVY